MQPIVLFFLSTVEIRTKDDLFILFFLTETYFFFLNKTVVVIH